MPSYVALLRAINVGGNNLIAMSDLRELADSLRLKEAKTLLQSGNLVFESSLSSSQDLEKLLEKETKKRFGFAVDYFVRSAAEWQKLVEANPFSKEAKNDPSHLLVMCLKESPEPKAVKSLQAAITIKGPEIVRAVGKQLYITYPEGIGRSKLTGALIEKSLATRGTGRNWNTVLKMAALTCE